MPVSLSSRPLGDVSNRAVPRASPRSKATARPATTRAPLNLQPSGQIQLTALSVPIVSPGGLCISALPLDLSLGGLSTSEEASPTPRPLPGGWTPTLDLGEAATARVQAKFEGQSSKWTPTKELGQEATARAQARLDANVTEPSSAGTALEAMAGHIDDYDMARALRNRARGEKKIPWSSRLVNPSASIARLADTAFLKTHVWKFDCEGVSHLISLRHFARTSELHIDGAIKATATHPMFFSLYENARLELPFHLDGCEAGFVTMVASGFPECKVIYECWIGGERIAEDTHALPPPAYANVVSAEVLRYELKRDSDGDEYVAFQIAVQHSADEPAAVIYKRFGDFDKLHTLIKSVHCQDENTVEELSNMMPKLPPKTFGVRRFGNSFLEERARGLDKYLQHLLKVKGICFNPDFLSFLELL